MIIRCLWIVRNTHNCRNRKYGSLVRGRKLTNFDRFSIANSTTGDYRRAVRPGSLLIAIGL